MAMTKFSKSFAAFPSSVRKNSLPLFLFFRLTKMEKVYGSIADKPEWIKLEFLMEPQYHICYLQEWMPRELDHLGDGLP
jgi:hypothetical protein